MDTPAIVNNPQPIDSVSDQQHLIKEKRNILLPILLIIFSIASVAISMVIVIKNISTRSMPKNTSNTTSDSTQNWKTYKNDTFGFSFSYPEELNYIWGFLNQDNMIDRISIFLGNYDSSTRKTTIPSDFQLIIHISNLAGKFTTMNPDGIQTPDIIRDINVIRTTDTIERYSNKIVVPIVIFQTQPHKIAVQLTQPDSTNKHWFDQILNTFEFTLQKEDAEQTEICKEKTTCEGSSVTNLGCVNPAATFCTCMGGTVTMRNNEQGQYGICVINEQEVDEWEYYRTKTNTSTL
ncbi:MAG: DUF333 domain-containing protein [Candidatus Gottesmanbacteria bacterium]